MKQIPALTPQSNILPLWQDITNQPKVQLDKLAIHNKASGREMSIGNVQLPIARARIEYCVELLLCM